LFNKHLHSQFGNKMYVLKTQNSANLKNILEEMVPNINLLITFVRRRYAVVFLRSFFAISDDACVVFMCLLTTTFSSRSVRSPVKDVVSS